MSRVVVYPSIYGESYGMAPMEAMLQGSQAILAENSGIVEDNPDVLTFPAGDSRSLANCISVTLRNDRHTCYTFCPRPVLPGEIQCYVKSEFDVCLHTHARHSHDLFESMHASHSSIYCLASCLGEIAGAVHCRQTGWDEIICSDVGEIPPPEAEWRPEFDRRLD